MEVSGLPPVGNASDVVDGAVVTCLHLVGILDHLVDEITQVQNEVELFGGGCAFIFINHSARGVERALVHILTADESEIHCARIVWQRCSDRATDAAAVAVGVGKPIPVSVRRLESANQNARGPVRGARDGGLRVRNDAADGFVLGYLDGKELACTLVKRTPGPEDDAVRIGIARGDTLRIEIAIRTASSSGP